MIDQILLDKRKRNLIILIGILAYALLLFLVQTQIPFGSYKEEVMRFLIPKYILNHGKLPTTFDIATYDRDYGVSYAYQANGAYLIDFVVMKVFSLMGLSMSKMYLVARCTNIFLGCLFAFIIIKISRELFNDAKRKIVFISMILLWNQMIYDFCLVNGEGLMLIGVALCILFILRGIKYEWDWKNTIGLGISNGIILISYLSGMGFCIVSAIAFISTFIFKIKREKKYIEMVKKGATVLFETFVISGWFYLRNYYLYGSVMGKQMMLKLKVNPYFTGNNVAEHAKKSMFSINGFLNWVKGQSVSFCGKAIATFNIIAEVLFLALTFVVLMLLVFAAIKIVKEWRTYNINKIIVIISMLSGIIITIAIDWYFSAFIDYVPYYARYLVSMVIPIVYFLIIGLDFIEKRVRVISKGWAIVVLGMLGICCFTFFYL